MIKKYTEITMSGTRHIYIRMSNVKYVYPNGDKTAIQIENTTINVQESLEQVLKDVGYEEAKEKTTGRSVSVASGNQGTKGTQQSADQTNQKTLKRRKSSSRS